MEINLRFEVDDAAVLSDLFFDGRRCTNPRICNYVFGKPMSKWVAPFNSRYVLWKGFLSELSEVLNTQRFAFHINGSADACEQFKRLIAENTPANFNVSFELNDLTVSRLTVNAALIDNLLSLLKNADSSLVSQLRYIESSIDMIDCQLIFGHYDELRFFEWLSYPILIHRNNPTAISIPLLLVSARGLSQTPYDICQLRQVEPRDVMILVVKNGSDDIEPQVVHLRQRWAELHIFSLLGTHEADRYELSQMKRFFDSYRNKKLREFLSNCSDDSWTDARAVKSIISQL